MVNKQNGFGFFPPQSDMDNMQRYAEMIYTSGMIPRSLLSEGDKKERIIAKIMIIFIKGYELNVKPLQALAEIGLIQGLPVISSKLMLSLILRDIPSAELIYKVISDTKCVIHARRRQSHTYTIFEYTYEYASKAGLIARNANTWGKYPRQMLKWRAVANMARTLFPDVIMGCYLSGEVPIEEGEVSFGPVHEDGLTESEEEKLASIPIPESIIEDAFISVNDSLDATQNLDISPFTPEQLYKLSLPENQEPESKDDITNIKMDLKLDLPELPKTKKIKLNDPKKINLGSLKIKKPSVLSAIGKIKKIGSVTPTNLKGKSTESKIKTIKNLDFSFGNKKAVSKKKKTVKKAKSLKDTKSYMNPDFYFSAPSSDKITNDLPWNILRDLIIPAVNTKDKDIFNAEISKYFREFMSDSAPTEPIGFVLLDAYNTYCENDLKKFPIDLEKEFHAKMDVIIKDMYSFLQKADKEMDRLKFLHSIIKIDELSRNYYDWILGFLESREMIKISDNVIEILV